MRSRQPSRLEPSSAKAAGLETAVAMGEEGCEFNDICGDDGAVSDNANDIGEDGSNDDGGSMTGEDGSNDDGGSMGEDESNDDGNSMGEDRSNDDRGSTGEGGSNDISWASEGNCPAAVSS